MMRFAVNSFLLLLATGCCGPSANGPCGLGFGDFAPPPPASNAGHDPTIRPPRSRFHPVPTHPVFHPHGIVEAELPSILMLEPPAKLPEGKAAPMPSILPEPEPLDPKPDVEREPKPLAPLEPPTENPAQVPGLNEDLPLNSPAESAKQISLEVSATPALRPRLSPLPKTTLPAAAPQWRPRRSR